MPHRRDKKRHCYCKFDPRDRNNIYSGFEFFLPIITNDAVRFVTRPSLVHLRSITFGGLAALFPRPENGVMIHDRPVLYTTSHPKVSEYWQIQGGWQP